MFYGKAYLIQHCTDPPYAAVFFYSFSAAVFVDEWHVTCCGFQNGKEYFRILESLAELEEDIDLVEHLALNDASSSRKPKKCISYAPDLRPLQRGKTEENDAFSTDL